MSSSLSSSRTRPEGESGAPSVELRASVLDAAVSLGFRNSVMKKWMFDSAMEGDEDEHAEHASSTPALTSPSTSEESSMSPYSIFCPPIGKGTSSDSAVHNVDLSHATLSHAAIAAFDDRKGAVSPFSRISLAVGPPPRNKLRKQQSAYTERGKTVESTTRYESDSGYVSDFTKKVGIGRTKKSLSGWRSKGKSSIGRGDEDGDSDRGYLSEAVPSSASKSKRNAKEKDKNKQLFLNENSDNVPALPPMNLGDRDPGALLETIKSSVLLGPVITTTTSSTSPVPDFASPESSSGHGHSMVADGYSTDAERRGRSKKKTKTGRTSKGKSKTRAGSPSSTEDANTPTKKKSIFRIIGRSLSRDAKDRDRRKVEEEPPPPLPEFRSPSMPLPIAERFVRFSQGSGMVTPTGNASASTSTASPTLENSEFGLTKALSSLEPRSSGSPDTLVPPVRFNDLGYSDRPWSNRSVPGAMNGGSSIAEGTGSGSALLDLPRERKDSSDLSPYSFVQRPEDGASAGNGEKDRAHEPEHNQNTQCEPELSLSRTTSSVVTTLNASGSPDLRRSPTKRIGKLLTGLVHSSTSGEGSGGTSPSSSRPPISEPNPHLTRRVSASLHFPNPFNLAAALTNPARANGSANGNISSEGRPVTPITPESFIIINEDEAIPTPLRERQFRDDAATGDEPHPSSLQVPQLTATTTMPPSPSTVRRRALLDGLGIVTTPTQSRSGTPIRSTNLNPNSIPNENDVKATRASVLAYYQVPPPSPPPTGPLPAPPQESEARLLSPGRTFASRSPSPLAVGARYSRSPSPGMGMGMGTGQVVRRGRESPFPTRPILPPQDSRQLVERVERYKVLYGADSAGIDGRLGGEDDDDEANWQKRQGLIDKHSSEYIRQARARGEKRVYFAPRQSYIQDVDDKPDNEFGDEMDYYYDQHRDSGNPVVPEVDPAEEMSQYEHGNEFDEEADERVRHSVLDSPTKIRELLREGLKPEDDDEDRRSFASSSVYSSHHSVLDADKSSKIRNGLVRRVAALYGGQDDGRLLREEIPEVPKLPAGLRTEGAVGIGATASAFATASAAAGQLENTQLKVTSSRYRF